MKLKRFHTYMATFQPTIMEGLKEEAKPFIGWRGKWSPDWIIEDGQFEGEWAMGVIRDDPEIQPTFPLFAWAAESQLTNIEEVEK